MIRLEQMAAESLGPWIAEVTREYIDSRMEAGESRAVAEANAARSNEETFPDGRPLETHRIFDILDDDERVGYVWLGPTTADPKSWWVYDIEILEQYRRRGHARAALDLAHAVASSLGATAIGLNVFGFNTGAQDLYRSLGYEVTAMQMKKELS